MYECDMEVSGVQSHVTKSMKESQTPSGQSILSGYYVWVFLALLAVLVGHIAFIQKDTSESPDYKNKTTTFKQS